MFALVDCNNFYASCERVFRPDLNGKPIVVLSNNDGCVIARSNEAKAIGIPMGAPAFEYEKIFAQNNVHVFSANFSLYGDMSCRIMSILEEYTPEMEIYSIDEAFLKLKGFEHYNLQDYGESMRKKVIQWTGVPISVGIAPTKALAKLANRIAKKYPERTNGNYIIDSEEKRVKALKWLKIEDVWGIGKQHSKKLADLGVKTAYDFTQLNDQLVRKQMAIIGLRLKYDLQGIPTLDLEEKQPQKNIATTRSFETNYTKYDDVAEKINTFAASCALKLRKQSECCNSIMVFIRTNRHRKDLPQYSRNIVVKLPYATSSTIEIVKFALLALKQIFKEGYHYKKAGVIIQDFSLETNIQATLFESRNERHISLMEAVDKINLLFGKSKVRLASQDLKKVSITKQDRLSPKYTTSLKDIIAIN